MISPVSPKTERRQPVHVVYGGAHLFKANVAAKMGELALKSITANAPDVASFASVFGFAPDLAEPVSARVVAKLAREPVEDFRIDFEDGYGWRPAEEEDTHAALAADAMAKGMAERTLPPFVGIRIKSFATFEARARGTKTLDIFLSRLVQQAGALPPGFVVTLPKVETPEETATLAKILHDHESRLKLAPKSIGFEIMVETPRAIFDAEGKVALPSIVAAAEGRCVAAHFGTYDYTAALGITAAHQSMQHPAASFAKHVMQVALADSGVQISDGATNVMPVGDKATVQAAWRLHYDNVRHSLAGGFHQGWDLHPAQIVARYAAVYAFYLEALAPATARLRAFVAKAAQASLVGDVFDDAATGQGLLNFFLRGLACGAVTEAESAATGLTLDEFRTRSFATLMDRRRS